MSNLFGILLLATLSSSEAILTILNSPGAVSPAKFAEAKEKVAADARDGKKLQQYVFAVTSDDRELSAKYLAASRETIRALAEKSDNALAWYLLSIEKNDMKALRRAADGGNVQALNALGTMEISRVCAQQDRLSTNEIQRVLDESFACFHRAVRAKDPNAMINLATCYQRGFGCRQNLPLAFQCFRAAAELGHPEAMDYLSACYENGHGIGRDAEKSLYWSMRARAARGNKAAEKWLSERL